MKTHCPAFLSKTPSLVFAAAIAVAFLSAGCAQPAPDPEPAPDPVERGRYIAIVAGCNDCHTDGYLMTEGQVPEDDWFLGSSMGWRGPWGTTYPPNLRLRAQEWTEDEWVETLHTRKALPPMPWINVNQMAEDDARAMYQYLKSLGAKGEHAPAAVPPDQEPATPYLLLEPQNLPSE